MATIHPITPCLWFDSEAEEAAEFYTSIFENARIIQITRYGQAGHEIHGRPAGSVMTVEFELEGQPFTALNGGPVFQFNEAISFQIGCDTQEEIDHFWDRLSEGGDERAKQCGWLKDKFGLSWQVVPNALPKLLGDGTSERSERVMSAVLQMKKIVIDDLYRAHEGDRAAVEHT